MFWYMLQALKQYVRVVYHPFLSADYTMAKGQPLAIVFISSFADGTRGVNLGEMDDDVISKRNMQGKGPFAHEFRVEVCDKKTGTESDASLDFEPLQARWCLPFDLPMLPFCICNGVPGCCISFSHHANQQDVQSTTLLSVCTS